MKTEKINLNEFIDMKGDKFYRHIRKNGKLVIERFFASLNSDKITMIDIGVVKRYGHWLPTGKPVQVFENGSPFWMLLNVKINNIMVDFYYYEGNKTENSHETLITVEHYSKTYRVVGEKRHKLVSKKNGKTSQFIRNRFPDNNEVIQEYLEISAIKEQKELERLEKEKAEGKRNKTRRTARNKKKNDLFFATLKEESAKQKV